jgi:hypothetical protein
VASRKLFEILDFLPKALTDALRVEAFEDGLRTGIGLLALHAPVLQLFERNGYARDGATHKRAWPQHAKITVQIFDFGLSRRTRIESIEHVSLR